MAFVNRSERKIQLTSNETSEVGPGQYLSQGIIKSQQTSKAPFNINTYRNVSIKKEDVPGPGSYDYDDKYEKMAKILAEQKARQKIEPLYKSIEYNFSNMGGAYSLLLSNEKKSPGFGSKEKRFKDNTNTNEIPGPGYYAKSGGMDSTNLDKSNSLNLNNVSILSKKHNNTNTGSPKRVVTIPAKGQGFGYNITNKGELVMNEDPDKSFHHKGSKEDSVGPGRYDLNSRWKKNSIDWSKSSPGRNNSSEKLQSTMTNSYDIHTLENMNDVDKNNTIVSKVRKTMEKINMKNSREKILKKIAENRKQLLNLNKENTDVEKLINDNIFSDNPGPGYYYNDPSESRKGRNSKPEKFQVFGSSSPRFPQQNLIDKMYNNEVGPGYYFQDSNFKKFKEREKIENKPKRVKHSVSLEKNIQYKEELNNNLGPGLYNPELPGRKLVSSIENFGSMERRFIEKQSEKEKSPGPGTYVNQVKWAKEKPKQVKEETVRKYEKNDKGPIITEKETFEVPPVGSYNSDILSTIGYKIAQKSNQYQSAIAPFSSMERRFNVFSSSENLVGPGQYYKEKKVVAEQKHPPFHTGDQRQNETRKPGIPGPGDYNRSSYFDWNKKSFNILYL